jgi:hypothetical protein
MKMVQASINNLTQLAAACGASSSPILAKLAAEGGPLQAMKQQLADLGLRVKSGALAGAQASQILARLASPSDELNALARQVNQGAHGVPMGTWHAVLTALQTALTES